MIKFVKKDDGLVTIEWIGIAAVMVLAAIVVTSFVMNGTSATGSAIEDKLDATKTEVTTGTSIGKFTPPT